MPEVSSSSALATPASVLALAAALPADADEGPLCRICFCPDAFVESGDAMEQLISPCKCSGSIGFVHCGCLRAWRRQQGFQRAKQCEMCHAQYRIPAAHKSHFDDELLGGMLPGPRACLRVLCGRLRSPTQAVSFALDLWRCSVLLAGYQQGFLQGCNQFSRTLAFGRALLLTHSQRSARRRGPLAPAQAPLARVSESVGMAVLAFDVLLVSLVSAYGAACYGFGEGMLTMVRTSWRVGRRVLGLGLRHLGPAMRRLLSP